MPRDWHLGGDPPEMEEDSVPETPRRLPLPGTPARDLYKPKGSFWANIARSPRFEQATIAVIMMNSVWIAVEVDNNPEEQLIRAPAMYQVIEHLFCFFFACEWVVRFMAYRRKQDTLLDMWFLADSFLVLMMVCETWILTIVMLLSDAVSGENLSTLTVLRLLRLLRITRISRLMRAFPEMINMLQGLISAMRAVLITLALILIMVYVFAIAFVQITRHDHSVADIFGDVWNAMVLLTIEAVLPDQGPLLNRLNEAGWYYGAMLFVFLVLATLTMVNMLIGILCEVACRVSSKEKEILDIEMVETKLLQIVKESLDHNHDNMISKKEFLGIVKNEKACKALHQVGVEATDLVAHAGAIFDDGEDERNAGRDNSEDRECKQRKLDFNEFMQLVLKLRGTNVATIRDITNLRKNVRDDLGRLERVWSGGGAHRRCSNDSNCTGTGLTLLSSPRCGALALEETDTSQVQVSFSTREDRLEALGCEVRDLGMRVGRMEDLLMKVLESQQQLQGMLTGRSPLSNDRQDTLHKLDCAVIDLGNEGFRRTSSSESVTGLSSGDPPERERNTRLLL